jgi:hypothetical protein
MPHRALSIAALTLNGEFHEPWTPIANCVDLDAGWRVSVLAAQPHVGLWAQQRVGSSYFGDRCSVVNGAFLMGALDLASAKTVSHFRGKPDAPQVVHVRVFNAHGYFEVYEPSVQPLQQCANEAIAARILEVTTRYWTVR